MNDLIVMDGREAILDPKVADAIAEYESVMKEMKRQEDLLKERILAEMESKGILKVDTPRLTLNYIGATERETFDSKKFRADNPDLYDDYIRLSPVKAQVRIKIK